MAHFQHPRSPQLPQRLRRQPDGLLDLCFAHGSQHLKAHLGDLLEGVALCRGAVDVLVVVIFQRLTGCGLGRLGDGKGHVRLERQQPPVQVREGDDLFRRQKAAVFLIQPILLEAAHVVFAAPRRLVQRPQPEGSPLLRLQIRQIKFHLRFLPFLGFEPFRRPSCRLFPSAQFYGIILLYLGKVVKHESGRFFISILPFFCAFVQKREILSSYRRIR